MREVTLDRQALLIKVKANREQHRDQYERAFANYATAMRQCLERELVTFKDNPHHLIVISEAPPEDHTKDYDVVICMIEMSVDDTIKLDQVSFQQYVLDKWNWKHAWNVSNSKYLPDR